MNLRADNVAICSVSGRNLRAKVSPTRLAICIRPAALSFISNVTPAVDLCEHLIAEDLVAVRGGK